MPAETLRSPAPAYLRCLQKPDTLGQLLGRAAHDFNSMIAAISGCGDLLKRKLPPDDPCRDYAAQILSTSRRATVLCRQLLAFGRGRPLRPEQLDLNDLVSESLRLLHCILGDEIEVVTRLDRLQGMVRADRSLIQQILVNLAMNARDAMLAGGKFAVGTRLEEGWVVLTASDTGCGMDEETRCRAFEPFFTTKGAGKGMGLGLSGVLDIVARHGGAVSLHSEPGHGATFEIRLPVRAV